MELMASGDSGGLVACAGAGDAVGTAAPKVGASVMATTGAAVETGWAAG